MRKGKQGGSGRSKLGNLERTYFLNVPELIERIRAVIIKVLQSNQCIYSQAA